MSPIERTRMVLRSILDADTRLILIALADHLADEDNAPVWPSLTRLEDLTGLGRSTIQRRLRDAASVGLVLTWEERGRGKVYQIRWQAIPQQEARSERGAQVPRDTVVRETPVSAGPGCTVVSLTPHRGQPDTPPWSERPPTVVSLTTEVDHRSRPKSRPSLSPQTPPSPPPPPTAEVVTVTRSKERELEAPVTLANGENPDQFPMVRLFGQRLAEVLAENEVWSVASLIKMTEREVRYLPGIGEGGVAQIRLKLESWGLGFAGRAAPTTGPPDTPAPEVKKRNWNVPQPAPPTLKEPPHGKPGNAAAGA